MSRIWSWPLGLALRLEHSEADPLCPLVRLRRRELDSGEIAGRGALAVSRVGVSRTQGIACAHRDCRVFFPHAGPGVGAPPPTEPLGSDRETRVDTRGTFRLAQLAPGRFDVEFRSDARDAPLLRLAGVEVPPNGKAVDARLDAVDLRGLVPAAQGR